MEAKVIHNRDEYHRALSELERLIDLEPESGTTEWERLELVSTLIEVYEAKHFPFETPDPIEAIIYRMEEQGLQQKDLVTLIGSKSKVSEVLSRKRPLTLSMIRNLHSGLNIPLDVLLSEQSDNRDVIRCDDTKWDLFPIREIVKRKWVELPSASEGSKAFHAFISQLGGSVPRLAMYRKGDAGEEYSLLAWVYRIAIKSKSDYCLIPYKEGTINKDFLKELVKLSWFDNGPILAKEYLNKHGISFVIENSLPATKVDGVAFFYENRPVIGLSLRYDRVDSFWFTVVHELIHISNHIKTQNEVYVDDLEQEGDDICEKEANRLAREALVPRSIWQRSEALHDRSPSSVKNLAEKLKIHPAIVAGRLRYELKNYKILTDMVGQGQVRKLFEQTA